MKGITLFELLVSITIAGIILGASTFAIIQVNQTLSLKRTTQRVAAFIERTSIEAIRKGYELNINVLSDRLIKDQQILNFDKGIRLLSVRPSGVLSLYATGVASPSQIVLSNRRKTCVLTLSLRGRVNSKC